MAEYLHPGVYVEEKSSGVKPIEGVGTSTAGFIGQTAKGVPNKATFITSWTQFVRKFGYLISGSYLPYAVQQFFANGGKRCYVVRVLSDAAAVAASVALPTRQTGGAARNALRVRAKGSGAWGNNLTILVADGSQNPTREFKLVVQNEGEVVEVFDNLSMDRGTGNYVETEVNDASEFIELDDLGPSVALANGQPVVAEAVTTAALPNPVVFAAGEVASLEGPDGASNTIALDTLAAPVTPAALVAAINTAWAPFNVSASLTTAASQPPANRLRIRHNVAGFDHYMRVSGTATGAGRPLDGLAGFAQGRGAALGATLKSAVGTTFDTTAPNNVLDVRVQGDALPAINLTAGAATPIDVILGEISAAFRADAVRGLLRVRREGDRLVIETANLGGTANDLQVGGAADAVLQFRPLDRPAGFASGTAVPGFGGSEPAFVQSDAGPFTMDPGSNFTLTVNNGTLGDASAPIVVTFNQGAAFPNLQQVTAQQVAAAIAAAAPANTVTAAVADGRVIVRQARRGNYYTLALEDGAPSANIRLKFDAQTQTGSADGEPGAPSFRPASNIVDNANAPYPLANGSDGTPVSNFDIIGTSDRKTGLHALDDVSDVNFIAIPGASDPMVIGAAVGYCTVRADCFFIADSPGKRDKTTPVTDPAHVQDFLRNRIPTKTSYGALYYPWLEIGDPVGAGKNPRRFVPPSGFVAGLYARIDNTRGVWKAPAGTEATIIGAIGLEYSTTDAEQDILNPIGVNCLREFPATGIVVWGARTLAAQADPENRYVPVRRYTNYLKQSIYRGTQWAVFEPNDAPLWGSLKANIEDFMMGEFRRGALAGATPEEAFFVQCDADLNPPSEVNAGRVNMELRFAPLKPAEFLIIRISQKTQRPLG